MDDVCTIRYAVKSDKSEDCHEIERRGEGVERRRETGNEDDIGRGDS